MSSLTHDCFGRAGPTGFTSLYGLWMGCAPLLRNCCTLLVCGVFLVIAEVLWLVDDFSHSLPSPLLGPLPYCVCLCVWISVLLKTQLYCSSWSWAKNLSPNKVICMDPQVKTSASFKRHGPTHSNYYYTENSQSKPGRCQGPVSRCLPHIFQVEQNVGENDLFSSPPIHSSWVSAQELIPLSTVCAQDKGTPGDLLLPLIFHLSIWPYYPPSLHLSNSTALFLLQVPRMFIWIAAPVS